MAGFCFHLKASTHSSLRREGGATLIEAVIVTPIFLVLIFGGIQAIWLSWQMLGVQYVTVRTVNDVVLGLCRSDPLNAQSPVVRCDSGLISDAAGIPSPQATISAICARRYQYVRDAAIANARAIGLTIEEQDIRITATATGGPQFGGVRANCQAAVEIGNARFTQDLGLPGDTVQVTIARNFNLLGGNNTGHGIQDEQVVRGLTGPILIRRSSWGVVEQFGG
jgi:hypothetical protein